MMNGEIALEGLEFFAYHGFYDEEQKIGNRYTVDVYVQADFEDAAANDNLAFTVDYQILYSIVNEVMEVPSRLLEYLAKTIADRVLEQMAGAEEVEVCVAKHNPPIGGVCAKAKITYRTSRTPY